jgi:hypothetical protein
VLHDLFAPEGLNHNLSSRGSVVFCLARRGLIYISSRVLSHGRGEVLNFGRLKAALDYQDPRA